MNRGTVVEGHGPSPLKGKGACFAGKGSVELVLGFKGKRVKRKRRHFPANKTVHPESPTPEG